MKRQITIAILTVCALCCFAQTKDVMVIEKNDNTKVQLNVEDIKRVLFESIYANPAGTLAEAVDLGLSSGVKWASWNLGASSKEDFGGYYGWADPTGNKTSQNNNDYPSATPPSEISGTSYDVVRSLWGGEWRLPTKDDVEEIMDECEWYISGKSVEAVGPNGNSIFFPIGGSRNGTEIEDVYDYGYYWTGTYLGENTPNPFLLVFDMTETNFGLANADRHYGLSIRPVFGKPIKISITTVTASDITESGATLSGHVSGVSSAITVGFIYGTSNNLSSTNGTRKSTTAIGGYSVPLSNLSAGTTYYYRAYALLNGVYYYGETKSFKTKNVTTYSVGDFYPNSSSPQGIVFYVQSGGQHGKIVSLDHGRCYWDTQSVFGTYSGCSNSTDGSKNNMPSSSSQVLAGPWCKNHGNGWYCPAVQELKTMASNMNTINQRLLSIDRERHLGWFWSSTEVSAVNAYIVNMTDSSKAIGSTGAVNKDQNYTVVAVKVF